MAGDADETRSDGSTPRPKVWGRRPYAGKQAREILNDISRHIARERPSDVEDPDDPSLSACLTHAPAALKAAREGSCPKGVTLQTLIRSGMTFKEAVVWYWFRYCAYDITEIHYAITGNERGGDPRERQRQTRKILSVLREAAKSAPDATPDDIPELVEDRKRSNRADIIDSDSDSDGDGDADTDADQDTEDTDG